MKASGWQARYLRDLPLHESQQESVLADGTSSFSYLIRPTLDFQQELLSLGAEIEILSPEWLRKQVANIINIMYGLYNKHK